MEMISEQIKRWDDLLWGPWMLVLLLGTGIFLTLRTRGLAWRNLGYAIRKSFEREARRSRQGEGEISSFSALATALASTMGTGNIVGVATAMTLGGPGAIVWMWISAAFGLSSKFGECMLAGKYRERESNGEVVGGPMYVMKKAFPNKRLGKILGWCFAVSTVLASLGIGNLTQANSIAISLQATFGVPLWVSGIVITVLALVILMGGIRSISRVSAMVVPFMSLFYMGAALFVIFGNIRNLPYGLEMIFRMAFSFPSVSGGLAGTLVASMVTAMRYGISRGIFSNEAGMGSAAITAAAATNKSPVAQAYINMTGTFWDTMVVCTLTGLCIAASGVLGSMDASGEPITGVSLTILAFQSVLGEKGAWIISIGITLFAFSTILGWEYQGEKAFSYLCHHDTYSRVYRLVFSLMAFIGATTTLEIVWNLSDIANGLMAIPNLICLLVMSGEITEDMRKYQNVIQEEKSKKEKKSGRKKGRS